MNKGVAVLTVCALFLSGVAIGALGMHLYYAQRLMRPGEPPAMAGRIVSGHLTRRLDLSGEQQEKLGQILEASRRRGAEMRGEMRPRVEQLIRRTEMEIEEILTPEQRDRFEQMRRRERFPIQRLVLGSGEREARGSGPGQPPGRGRRGPRP